MKIYQYYVQIAKDPKNTCIRLHTFDILLESEKEYVIQNGGEYRVLKKNSLLQKWFHQKDYFWNYSHYAIILWTTTKGGKSITRIKAAIKSLVDEYCFLSDEYEKMKDMLKEQISES